MLILTHPSFGHQLNISQQIQTKKMQKPSPYVSGGEYSLNSEFTFKAKCPKT